MMRIKAELRLEGSEAIFDSVQADNDGYVEGSFENGLMTFSTEGEPGSVRNTLNDLIACIQNAQGITDALQEDDGLDL